jgi:hypothetical protein
MDEHSRIVRAGSVMLRGVRRPDPAKGRPDALRFVFGLADLIYLTLQARR